MNGQQKWVDGAITEKAIPETSRSWWTEPQTREQFDAEVHANLTRMTRSRFGRIQLQSNERVYGDSE